MAKQVVSISIDAEDRKFLAEQGWKISNFIKLAILRYKQWAKEIENLQWLIANLKEQKLKQDLYKQRIQRFISCVNELEDKHDLLTELAKTILDLDAGKPRLFSILKEINEKLHYTEYADRNPN